MYLDKLNVRPFMLSVCKVDTTVTSVPLVLRTVPVVPLVLCIVPVVPLVLRLRLREE